MVEIRIIKDSDNESNDHRDRLSFFKRPDTSAQNSIGISTYQLAHIKEEHSPSINKRYVFIKKLSDGSASKLYLALDTKTNKEVIIKKISKNEDWRYELRILKILKNANAKKLLTYLDFSRSSYYTISIKQKNMH